MNSTTTEVHQHDLPTPIPTSDDPPCSSPINGKRKREDEEQQLKDIIIRVLKPYPESIYDKPYILKPLRVVSRSRLPLSFLDIVTPNSVLPSNRLFSANIEVLECHDEQLIVIAALEKEPGLYAIERVKQRVYALCQLCAWVQIGHIEDGTTAAYEHVTRAARHVGAAGMERWWDVAVVRREGSEVTSRVKRAKLDMAPPKLLQNMPVDNAVVPLAVERTDERQLEQALPIPTLDAAPSLEQVFETLICQYLDALYISKTSLAFFVKGPLSRARNQFGSTSASQTPLKTFADQLRTMLLTVTAVDKKYREKLPATIKSFPHQSLSDAEAEMAVTAKRRKSKRVPKLSRDGFYSIEEDYCRKWWLNTESPAAKARPEESFEQLVRRRVGELRKRETLAQIVLVLEIFALEASPDFKLASETQNVETGNTQVETQVDTLMETQLESQVETQLETQIEAHLENQVEGQIHGPSAPTTTRAKRKPRKPVDIELLLDLLLDKLSIWQSIEADIGSTDAEKKHDHTVENSEKLHEQDMLVSFCIDVVIPFYKSRIPKQASLVNKKLGGPKATSPAKPENARRVQGDKAGERRARRPLQKTLSEVNGFTRSTRPPSLMRSATDSQTMPRLKREASELSLFDIPAARPSHRDSLSQLKHLKQRQVDMHAISAATEARLKQKAKIEQDLKDAISTLKRPNRGQAVKEFVDAADQRSLGSASMRKKTMGPIRKILSNVRSVQVTATPKHKRGFNALEPAIHIEKEEGEKHAPSSGDFWVPSSGMRGPGVEMIGATPATRRFTARTAESGISETPSRKLSQPVFVEQVLGSSPPQPLKFSAGSAPASTSFEDFVRSQLAAKHVPSTPMKRTHMPCPEETLAARTRTPAQIFATPVKTAPAEALIVPPKTSSDGAEGMSIYDALGWNDYDDELA